MTDLGTLSGGDYSMAYDVNGDGSVVVGTASISDSSALSHAFRWTTATGMVDIGTLPGGTTSTALGVNGDGSVVVGYGETIGGQTHAFRWTTGTQSMADLGTLGGNQSAAKGVSSDGSVVVGESVYNANGDSHAFRWTTATGMKDLNTLLTNAGVNMTGITLRGAGAVSGNGEFIVGQGNFPNDPNHAYLVPLHLPNSPRSKGKMLRWRERQWSCRGGDDTSVHSVIYR